jgi:hypothetical protein
LLSTRIQLIEADRVSNPIGMPETDRFMGGIEFDENGVALRCHVRSTHPGEIFGLREGCVHEWVPEPFYGAETKQLRVLHIMDTQRVGQVRGVPYLAPVIEALKGLDRYTESTLTAAVLQSFFTVFIKTETGEDGFADEGEDVHARRVARDGHDGARRPPRHRQGRRPRPGRRHRLMADPKQPNRAIRSVRAGRAAPSRCRARGPLRAADQTLRVQLFGVSGCDHRGVALNDAPARLADAVVLPAGVGMGDRRGDRAGLLSAPGFFENPLVRQAYCRAEWIGPAMGALDPESEVNAAENRVRNSASRRCRRRPPRSPAAIGAKCIVSARRSRRCACAIRPRRRHHTAEDGDRGGRCLQVAVANSRRRRVAGRATDGARKLRPRAARSTGCRRACTPSRTGRRRPCRSTSRQPP